VRRTNRRIRGSLAGVAVLLVLSLIVGNLALRQRDDARAAADVADARQLASASLTEKDGIASLLLARQAVELDDSAQTRSALLAALQREPAAIATMHADGAVPGDLAEWLQLSPDGHTIASGGARTTVDFFDAVTYQPLGAPVNVGDETTRGAFSPDGRTLAVAAGHQVVRIDVNAMAVGPIVTSDRVIAAVSFTPRGDRLLTAESNQREGFLIARDPVTFEPTGVAVRSESGPITAMDSSADGRLLVTTGFLPNDSRGYTELWNEGDLQQVGTYGVGGNDVALSPDVRMAAIAAAENELGTETTDSRVISSC
jgi:WD40 repeat protein